MRNFIEITEKEDEKKRLLPLGSVIMIQELENGNAMVITGYTRYETKESYEDVAQKVILATQ